MSGTEAKKHPATARKLRKQREEGVVPSAQTLAALVGTVAGLAALAALGLATWRAMANGIVFAAEDLRLPFHLAVEAGLDRMRSLLLRAVLPVAAAAAGMASLVGMLYTGGPVISPKPVLPKLARLSPPTNLKRILGRRGWVEAAAAGARLVLWAVAAGVVIALWLPRPFSAVDCAGACQARLVMPPAWLLLALAGAVMILGAAVDMRIQRALFLHEQRMTDTELKRERRDQAGNPEIRRERRRLGRDGGAAAGSVGLGRANMCFFRGDRAIAVRFKPPDAPLPRIAAKARGAAEVAAMRAAIRRAGHPEAEDETIVTAGIGADLGGVLDQGAFKAFGRALKTMFESHSDGAA